MSNAQQFLNNSVSPITATILSGQTDSSIVKLFGTTAIGIQFPAVFTGATVSFQGSMDDGATFVPIYDAAGVAVSVTVNVSTGNPLDAKTFAPYDQIRVVSASSEGADRGILIKPFPV